MPKCPASFDDYLQWRPKFATILDAATHPLEWLDERIASGDFALFVSPNAAIICSIRVYPSGALELSGELATGNLREIVASLIPSALSFGKERGCAFASIASRPGWQRALRNEGWSPHQVCLRKPL